MRGVVSVHGDANLTEIVSAAYSARRLARRLHGRQQQRNKNRDRNQHFDKRKTVSARPCFKTLSHDYSGL